MKELNVPNNTLFPKKISLECQYQDFSFYHLSCDCHDADHMVELCIERIDPDKENPKFSISIDIPLAPKAVYGNLWQRFKCALNLLFNHKIDTTGNFIVSQENFNGFVKIINDDFKRMKNS